MVSDGFEFAVGYIERLFDDARLKTKKVVAKFKPKFRGPYRVLEVKNNNIVIRRLGKRLAVNFDQVRIYCHRKCEEMEIRTGSSDSNSSRHKSSSFESVQRRSNESQKKGLTEETVLPSTSWYNLRPRKGTKVEFRPTIEMKTQQGGPVRARNSREKHYSPYIEEQARSGSKNTRRRGSQQQNGQKRKGGANTNRSLSLEVLVRDVNYKS
ncbi:uncharacterized protein TNCV_4618331 [Trichonephila clavipes]|nr:uncharacterized protein TNCV_4618331 [Trichonephila clavipes]